MSKTIENLKSGNYEIVDNQGVSVTIHFIECLEKELADLEAKLAESEEQRKNAYKEGLLQKQFDKDMEIAELKQQLAEKEKENQQLKFQINVKDGENAQLEKRIYELDGNGVCTGECWCCDYFKNGNDGYSVCTYKAKQDKIDFAIAELEKVRGIINASARYDHIIWDFDIKAHIDQQIKELKEKK